VIPHLSRSDVSLGDGTYQEESESDNWYVDFDTDFIPDEGKVIARIPDYGTDSDVIVQYLETAIGVHENGGLSLDSLAKFNDSCDSTDTQCYETPPYCVSDNIGNTSSDCSPENMYSVLSAANFISFSGHGSTKGFWDNSRKYRKWYVDHFENVDLQTNHPVVNALTPCDAGTISDDDDEEDMNLSVEFMRAGASNYISKLGSEGVCNMMLNLFPDSYLELEYTIGSAFFDSIRYTLIEDSAYGSPSTNYVQSGYLLLYGDPTLLLK